MAITVKQEGKTRGAVLYTRVSGNEQDRHGTSPETQRDACRAKALALGLPVVAEYYDGGVSGGFLLARREFQAALADIKAGRADTLICPNVSRYSRDVEHQQAVKKAVKAAGGSLVFCDMEFADTPEGDLNFTIQGGFAEYERKVIRARTMGGKRRRAEEGRQSSPSRPPLGYHIVLKADVLRGTFPAEMLGRYVVDEARAPIIRELFTRYAAGEYGTPRLAQELNARGVPPPRGGKLWRCSTLRVILTNPAYKGEPAYGRRAYHLDEGRLQETHRITGQPLRDVSASVPAPEGYAVALSAPPLVTGAVWDAAQERLATNRGRMGGNPRRARMLSGRIYCPCGHKATCRSSGQPGGRNGPDNYQCSQARNAQMWNGDGGRACSLELFRVTETEGAVVRAFLSAAQEPEALEDARREYRRRAATPGQDAGEPRREIAALDRALALMRDEEAAAVQGQMAGIRAGASPDAYAAVFADIAARRKDAEDRRGQVSRLTTSGKKAAGEGQEAPGAGPIDGKALADAALVLSAPDVPGETKRDIIGLVVGRVVCRRGGADVHFLPGFGVGNDQTRHSEQTLEWLGDGAE